MFNTQSNFYNKVFQRLLLTATIVFFSNFVFSQSTFLQGYIVCLNGDTIRGKLVDGGAMKNSRICMIQTDGIKIQSYKPFEIIEYHFDNWSYYVSKKVNFSGRKKSVFVEYLVKGKKNLYYHRNKKGDHFLIDLNDSLLIEIPYESRIESVNNKMYGYKTTRHIGFLETYFSDCPQLFAQIEAIEEPDLDNLTGLTKKYHDIVCGENSCLVFKKNKAPVKLGFEPRIEFSNLHGRDGEFLPQFGGMLTLWLPESNRNLYAKAGFFYSENSLEGQYIYKIPLRFEYLFTDRMIQPKLNAGFNFYALNNLEKTEGKALSLAAGGGFLVKLNKHFGVSIDCESDVKFLNYFSGFFESFTFGGGLFLQF